jgi:hypothetical protein
LRISTSDFSGFVFVISLKSAIVIYRVDGVSGLNVLTGIIAKVFHQQLFEVGRPSILSLAGKSVIGLQTMLSVRPCGRRERSIYQSAKGTQHLFETFFDTPAIRLSSIVISPSSLRVTIPAGHCLIGGESTHERSS